MDRGHVPSFGDLLRRYRTLAGLTQEELAARAGLGRRSIGDLERGNTTRPWRETVRLLAEALALEAAERAGLEAAARRVSPPAPGTDDSSLPRKAPAPRHNLPVQVTSFVGREREVLDVGEQLVTGHLLTLTGSGGCGKTRLATQAAADLVERFPDGVWLVDLAPLALPSLVPQTVAFTLGVRDEPGVPMTETLQAVLRSRRTLIILDNCEHLIDACARMAEALIRTCPHLRLLATSREALNVAGETTSRVRSLNQVESVRLFSDRAMAVRPDFAVTAPDASNLAAICERLDGIPLAIELAAARVRVLTLEQIASRLDDRFRFLTGGSRTAMRRQQTLQATIDWSYDLLDEEERAALRRLAVFAGGWTLEAAEAVCGFAPLAPAEVFDRLTALVDKSLIAAGPGGTEERYRLLETLRQYAQEKLLATGEERETRDRHRDWCLALVERAAPELTGPRQGAWLDRLEAEHDNLRAALTWCRVGPPAGEIALRLAPPLMTLWFQRGYAREGQVWLEEALARGGAAPVALRADALNAASFLALRQGDNDRARDLAQEVMHLDAGGTPGRPRLVSPKVTLAHIMMGQQQWERARELVLEELADTRRSGDRRAEALVCGQLGRLETYAGAYAVGQAWLEQSIAVARGVGDPFLVQSALMHLAVAKMAQGDCAGARAAQSEGAAILTDLRNREGGPFSLTVLGQIARLEGAESEACALFAEAVRLFHDLGGERRYLSWTLDGVAGTAATAGRWARAVRLFGAATAARQAVGDAVVPVLADRNERDLAMARASLDGVIAAAWAEGQAMTLEQAVAYALETDGV